MGTFSWIKAERSGKVANVRTNAPLKILIPQEFGGGFIKGHYEGYGEVFDGEKRYSLYEIIAFWNADLIPSYFIPLGYNGDKFPNVKCDDEYTTKNSLLGLRIGCYVNQVDKLKYPLKLVSVGYKGTYEDCEGRSYDDPNQGLTPLTWEEADAFIQREKERSPEKEATWSFIPKKIE